MVKYNVPQHTGATSWGGEGGGAAITTMALGGKQPRNAFPAPEI